MTRSVIALVFMFVILPGTFGDCSCSGSNCCNTNCVSSDMKIEELKKGIVSVSELSAGDIIRGLRGAEKTPGWCRVDAVYPRESAQNFTTYNGFTKEHMVVDGQEVRPHGDKGLAVSTQLYTLATECDAAVNAAGLPFTPLSTTFCPHELAWSEYLVLIAAIRRVTSRTGYFWYLSDAFHDSDAAKVPKWADMLPGMCTEMLKCARESKCEKFEKTVNEFVDEHLNKKYVLVVKRVFPNLGGDVNKAGTVSQVVRQDDHTNIILISSLSVIGCMLVAIAVLIYCLLRVVKKKSNKLSQEKPSLDDVSPGKFAYQKA
ncbi:uncharacterized protein LOC114521088 [Dendronephthya gigantea]|uniref:uncharacterized protein LOC114521088 n=1 Tax=Dendronephthya gigantea TaxID=151771 RepID=UPI00106DBC02|nr:uncharacterized protein LOC114521088 [Dendronephthya gigantea]